MSNFKYYIHGLNLDEKVGSIEFLPGVDNNYKLNEGVKMGADFPSSVELSIAPDSGNIITDFIDNIDKLIIPSEEAKELLIKEGMTDEVVEYLPFNLKNKNGRLVKDKQYHVANLLRSVDCLDRKKSDYAARKDGSKIVVIRKLYLDEKKIPEDAKLFRLGECPKYIIIRSDLLQAIQDAGLTGLCVMEQGKIR